MKLLLVADDGTVIDHTADFTRPEWDALTPYGALALLHDLNPDAS